MFHAIYALVLCAAFCVRCKYGKYMQVLEEVTKQYWVQSDNSLKGGVGGAIPHEFHGFTVAGTGKYRQLDSL